MTVRGGPAARGREPGEEGPHVLCACVMPRLGWMEQSASEAQQARRARSVSIGGVGVVIRAPH